MKRKYSVYLLCSVMLHSANLTAEKHWLKSGGRWPKFTFKRDARTAEEQFGAVWGTPKQSDGLFRGIFFFARRNFSEASNIVN